MKTNTVRAAIGAMLLAGALAGCGEVSPAGDPPDAKGAAGAEAAAGAAGAAPPDATGAAGVTGEAGATGTAGTVAAAAGSSAGEAGSGMAGASGAAGSVAASYPACPAKTNYSDCYLPSTQKDRKKDGFICSPCSIDFQPNPVDCLTDGVAGPVRLCVRDCGECS